MNRGCSSDNLKVREIRESNRRKVEAEEIIETGESSIPLFVGSKELCSETPTTPTIFLNLKNIQFSRNDLKRKIKLPATLTTLLAEDIGIQIGDGGIFIQKEKNGDVDYRVECYGHIKEDKIYFKKIIIPLKYNLFNLHAKLKEHKSAGSCYLRVRSKALVKFYTEVIGLPLGRKCKKVRIPSIILNSPAHILLACIRGIADTDFSLTFKKKHEQYNYPVLHFGCASKALTLQIHTTLQKLGITCTYYTSKNYDKRTKNTYIKHELYINGKRNLELWMKLIGFHNPVHLTKYLLWKQLGICPPRTTLQERIKILNSIAGVKI